MYNRPTSNTRYQEPNMDSINLKERQLYLQSSSISINSFNHQIHSLEHKLEMTPYQIMLSMPIQI